MSGYSYKIGNQAVDLQTILNTNCPGRKMGSVYNYDSSHSPNDGGGFKNVGSYLTAPTKQAVFEPTSLIINSGFYALGNNGSDVSFFDLAYRQNPPGKPIQPGYTPSFKKCLIDSRNYLSASTSGTGYLACKITKTSSAITFYTATVSSLPTSAPPSVS